MGRPRKNPAPEQAESSHDLRLVLASAEAADLKFMNEVLGRVRYERFSRFVTHVFFKKMRVLAASDLWFGLDDAGIREANPGIFSGEDDFTHIRSSQPFIRLKNALKKKAKEIERLRTESDPKKMLENATLTAVETVRDAMIFNSNSEHALDAASQVMDRQMPKPQRQVDSGGKVIVISGDLLGQLGAAEREMKQITGTVGDS